MTGESKDLHRGGPGKRFSNPSLQLLQLPALF